MTTQGRTRQTRNKICITGYTGHGMSRTPWANTDWEIWSLNDHHFDLAGVTIPDANDRLRWFQLHDWNEGPSQIEHPESVLTPKPTPEASRQAETHLAWLKEASANIPVYLLRPYDELPDAEVLDMEAMNAYFDRYFTRGLQYWTNSISYMIAFAIMELAPNHKARKGAEIAVTGVDMMVAGGLGSEYGYQRPSCEVFLGIAAGLGITVTLPEESDLLLSAFPYGDLGDHSKRRYRKRLLEHRNELSRRRGSVDAQLQQLQAARAELTGAISFADWTLGAHLPGDPGEGADGKVYGPDSHKRGSALMVGGSAVEVQEDGKE